MYIHQYLRWFYVGVLCIVFNAPLHATSTDPLPDDRYGRHHNGKSSQTAPPQARPSEKDLIDRSIEQRKSEANRLSYEGYNLRGLRALTLSAAYVTLVGAPMTLVFPLLSILSGKSVKYSLKASLFAVPSSIILFDATFWLARKFFDYDFEYEKNEKLYREKKHQIASLERWKKELPD